MLRIIITEPTAVENTKSMGCNMIESTIMENEWCIEKGITIEYQLFDEVDWQSADLYLFSVLSHGDLFHMHRAYKHKGNKMWIAGGYTTRNPYPLLHFFDLLCVGEGEEWIIKALKGFLHCGMDKDKSIELLSKLRGSLSLLNKDKPVDFLAIENIDRHGAYLNKSHRKGHGDVWYVEGARGCASKCPFCSLAFTTKYREASDEHVDKAIAQLAGSKNRSFNIYAPDQLGMASYERHSKKIIDSGLHMNFGSMRLDRILETDLHENKAYTHRMGIDGMSNRIRRMVGKAFSDAKIVEVVAAMAEKGYKQFKFFFIFSYPFEDENDFYQFESLISDIEKAIQHIEKPIHLRLKFTPFMPQELTPMELYEPYYNQAMADRLNAFFLEKKSTKRKNTKLILYNEGIMSKENYLTSAYLHRASYEALSREMLIDRQVFQNIYLPQLMKQPKVDNLVECFINKDKRRAAYEKLEAKANNYNNTKIHELYEP